MHRSPSFRICRALHPPFVAACVVPLVAWAVWPIDVHAEPDAPVTAASANSENILKERTFRGEVDFIRDVQPILQKRCVSCHGPDLQHGGLNLGEMASAAQGGHTRRAILGGRPEENELLRRVTAADVGVRMPKNETPLTPQEIGVLKAWVEQGSPWATVIPKEEIERRASSPIEKPRWEVCLDRFDDFARAIMPYVPWLLATSLVIGVIERYQQVTLKRRARATDMGVEPRPRRFDVLMKITRSHYLNVALLLALGITLHRLWEAAPETKRTVTGGSSAASLSASAKPAATDVDVKKSDGRYGTPPRPIRPQHPKRLSGVYYRGNCERSAELYNGGSYQTARFRIALCDAQGNALEVGDSAPEEGLFVQVDMERAKGTHPSFFSADTIAAVAFSTQVYSNAPQPVRDPLVRLEIVEPDWTWTARYPLGKPDAERADRLERSVYLYRGTPQSGVDKNGKFSGEFHYAVVAELTFADGKLTDESDLWMGSLLVVPALEFPTPGKVPLSEWFDYRPLPEIPGENTTSDPKLLGLPPAESGGETPAGGERTEEAQAPDSR